MLQVTLIMVVASTAISDSYSITNLSLELLVLRQMGIAIVRFTTSCLGASFILLAKFSFAATIAVSLLGLIIVTTELAWSRSLVVIK